MPAPYTDITFTNAREGGITAQKLNKLRDDLSTAISGGGGGTGTGDMTKAVYDTNSDNIVDQAAAVPWTGITGKPTSFAPSAHASTHLAAGSDPIALATSVLAGLCPAVDNTTIQIVTSKLSCVALAWTAITGKPSTFPPDSTAMLKSVYDTNADNIVDHAALADAAPWTGITGKPATFPPDAHAATHLDNGTDVIPTTTNARTGLCPKLPSAGSAFTTFLRGDGTFSVPTGDMSKAVYDVNGDGISDHAALADTAPWTGITGKPATFPPDSTAMLKSVYDTNLNGKVDGAETADAVPWTGVTGKPATFPPDSSAMLKSVYDTNGDNICDHAALADTAPWTGITGKPATFSPSAHAPSHLDNGSDAIPVATTSRTGSLRILNGTATTFLDGTGNWSTPAPAGTVNPGTWTALTYSTGWTQNTTAQFRVETNGSFQKVICQGIINYASGAASLAFTFPAGARPGVTRGCVLAGFDSSGDVLIFSVNVSTAGAVTVLPMVRQSFVWPSATNGSVYLDNLTFAL